MDRLSLTNCALLRAVGANIMRTTHHPAFSSICRWCSRVDVSGLATRLVGGWWPGRDGFGSELRAGFAGHDFRYRWQQWWRRWCRRCHLCGRRDRERDVGLERRPQHRGVETSRLGRLATIQSAAAAAATPGTTPVWPRHGVQFRLLKRRQASPWSEPSSTGKNCRMVGAYLVIHGTRSTPLCSVSREEPRDRLRRFLSNATDSPVEERGEKFISSRNRVVSPTSR